jgi:hypothetical protein
MGPGSTPGDRPGVVHDLIDGDRYGTPVTQDHLTERIPDQDDVDARSLGPAGGDHVVGGHHHQPPRSFAGGDLRRQELAARPGGVGLFGRGVFGSGSHDVLQMVSTCHTGGPQWAPIGTSSPSIRTLAILIQ